MGIFPAFAYDVFVSYARDDDVDSSIGYFADRLKRELERRARNYDHKAPIRKSELFFDTRSMPMNGTIVDECAKAVAGSAFFLAFLSETYRARKYCCQELEMFLQASDEAKRRRLFLTVLDDGTAQRRSDWPGMLPPDFLYVPLFDDRGRIPPYLIGPDNRAVGNPQISAIVEQLAGTVFARSVELGLTRPGKAPPPPAARGPRVAVGAVTRDLEALRREVVELLERSGKFEVQSVEIDGFDEISEQAEAVERLRGQIGAAPLFIQLASYHKVRLPLLGGHLSLQRQALPAAARYLLRPQPLPAGAEARETRPEHLETIRQLIPAEPAAGAPGESPTLLAEIEKLMAPPGAAVDAAAQLSILVGANDARDRPCAERLQEVIGPIWREVAPAGLPCPELSVYPFSMLRDIDAAALDHHGFLLLMATVAENSRFHYTEQSRAFVRRMRLQAAGVALFSPDGPISLPQFVIIRCEPEIDLDSLRTFLERVAQSYRGPQDAQPPGRAA